MAPAEFEFLNLLSQVPDGFAITRSGTVPVSTTDVLYLTNTDNLEDLFLVSTVTVMRDRFKPSKPRRYSASHLQSMEQSTQC